MVDLRDNSARSVPKMERRGDATKTPVGERSRTKQSFRDGSDINAIMRKYMSTGDASMLVGHREGFYGDFTSADDYLQAMCRVREAEILFDTLPSKVRDYVDNDPAKLLALVYDPDRREELEELGLVPPAAEPVVPETLEVAPSGDVPAEPDSA